jgi:hypothetical protein
VHSSYIHHPQESLVQHFPTVHFDDLEEIGVTPPKLALANQVESLAVYLVKPRMVNR